MTVGEVVVFAGRIRSVCRTGGPETGAAAYRDACQSLPEPRRTYEPYLRYLKAEGVVGTELDGLLEKAATRAQMAHIAANVLPEEPAEAINDEAVTEGYATGRYIRDVTDYTPYQQEILRLYKWGVVQGSDSTGSFRPAQSITRGEAASVLMRLIDPALRVTLTWTIQPAYSAAGTTLAQLAAVGTYMQSPTTAAQIRGCVYDMLSRGSATLSLRYQAGTLDEELVNRLMETSLASVKTQCEQMYNTVSCTYDMSKGTVALTFSAAGQSARQLEQYRTDAMAKAIAVHDNLWAAGTLRADMTETEKAKVYYKWLCDNCVYDTAATDHAVSHLAYGALCAGKGVCDGYTGAYNLLLKLEGIACYALANDSHIWTVATLDGADVHIDTTWGDSGAAVDYGYFAMSAQRSWQVHPW